MGVNRREANRCVYRGIILLGITTNKRVSRNRGSRIYTLSHCYGRSADFRYNNNMLFLFCPTHRQTVAILPARVMCKSDQQKQFVMG